MSACGYELGTVAMVGYDDLPPRVMMRVDYDGNDAWIDKNYKIQDRHNRVQSIRPLVVLDLDLAAHIGVDRLVADLRTSGFYDIADQIEAQTRPPKPAEPTGLGAVVEDEHGCKWVLYTHPDSTAPWTDGGTSSEWSDVPAVRVLSEGVIA